MASATAVKTLEKLRNQLQMIRSIRGEPLPGAIIDRIVRLSEESDYQFVVSSNLKNERFFRQNAYNNCMRFFNCDGKEFTFIDAGRLSRRNQTFVGVMFIPERKIARVYVHFAYTY